MKGQRNSDRTAESYRRKAPVAGGGKSILIITEGEKTEPNYFKALRDRLRLTAADIEIASPSATDPIALTTFAIERRDSRAKEAKKGLAVPYDEVWVVFDWEAEHDADRYQQGRQAAETGRVKEISFADSTPCFEYWLLLHFAETTKPFERCDQVKTYLRKSWKDYEKNASFSETLFDDLSEAVKRSQRCRIHHEKSGAGGNPSTNVDLLAVSMNEATREHLRIF